MNDNDTKPKLPIHMTFEASDYARIKMPEMLRVKSPRKPEAELIRFIWVTCHREMRST